MDTKNKVVIALVLIAFTGFIISWYTGSTKNVITGAIISEKDELAMCLTDNGVKMYGADWCGHCKTQKELFGNSFQFIDYVECTEEKEACETAGITGYPTWVFPDGENYPGVQPLEELKRLADC